MRARTVVIVAAVAAVALAAVAAWLATDPSCDDSPSGVHCDHWSRGDLCCYCQFGDGGHANW